MSKTPVNWMIINSSIQNVLLILLCLTINNGRIQYVTYYCVHGFEVTACDTAEPYITYMYTGIDYIYNHVFIDVFMESYHCYIHFIEYHKCCENQELCNRYTVEPPNKGHFGNGTFVLSSEVVLISEVHEIF